MHLRPCLDGEERGLLLEAGGAEGCLLTGHPLLDSREEL